MTLKASTMQSRVSTPQFRAATSESSASALKLRGSALKLRGSLGKLGTSAVEPGSPQRWLDARIVRLPGSTEQPSAPREQLRAQPVDPAGLALDFLNRSASCSTTGRMPGVVFAAVLKYV